MNPNSWQQKAPVLLGLFVVAVSFGWMTPSAGAQQAVVQVAQADSTQTSEDEAASEPNQAKEKASGFLQTITSMFEGTVSWIKAKIKGLTDKVDAVFGFEKAEGPQALFGTALYVFLLLVALFILAFVFNIIKDMFSAMFSSSGRKPPPRRPRR